MPEKRIALIEFWKAITIFLKKKITEQFNLKKVKHL